MHAEPNKRAYLRAAVFRRLSSADRDAIAGIEMIRKLPSDIWQVLMTRVWLERPFPIMASPI